MATRGCYLTFSDASQGTLFLHWSEAPVAGALAFFEPRKSVPAFKFRTNGGRSGLLREMSGGRIRRFYTGLCQFVKLAKSFDSTLVFYEHGTLPSVEIALIDGAKTEFNVLRVKNNAPVESLASVTAVGVAPGSNPCFDASTFSREYFIPAATREGSSLAI